MQNVSILADGSGPKTILALGAHADDIEIGCGGTILKLLEQNPSIDVSWVVLGAAGERRLEATRSAAVFLAGARGRDVTVRDFKDGYFPYVGAEIKDFFEELKRTYSPDLILTHYRHDRHQDHRVVSDLTWNTFRNHLILEYEIVKYDGDLGSPNVFVQLTADQVGRKIATVMDCFKSQQHKSWFTEDTLRSMLRLRGVECQSSGRYAEAFYGRKLAC